MPAVNNEYDDDEEYRAFEDYVDSSNKAAATAKSYRTTYRKLRKLLNKPIRDAAQPKQTDGKDGSKKHSSKEKWNRSRWNIGTK